MAGMSRAALAAALSSKRSRPDSREMDESDREKERGGSGKSPVVAIIMAPKSKGSGIAERIMQKKHDGGEIGHTHDDDDLLLGDSVEEEGDSAGPSLSHGGAACPHCGHVTEGDEAIAGGDEDFLNHDSQVAPDDMGSLDNATSPASSEEDDEQEEGKVDLESILRAVRSRHQGR